MRTRLCSYLIADNALLHLNMSRNTQSNNYCETYERFVSMKTRILTKSSADFA